jgi:hypothetical protein
MRAGHRGSTFVAVPAVLPGITGGGGMPRQQQAIVGLGGHWDLSLTERQVLTRRISRSRPCIWQPVWASGTVALVGTFAVSPCTLQTAHRQRRHELRYKLRRRLGGIIAWNGEEQSRASICPHDGASVSRIRCHWFPLSERLVSCSLRSGSPYDRDPSDGSFDVCYSGCSMRPAVSTPPKGYDLSGLAESVLRPRTGLGSSGMTWARARSRATTRIRL